jgi:hypothetical protein
MGHPCQAGPLMLRYDPESRTDVVDLLSTQAFPVVLVKLLALLAE